MVWPLAQRHSFLSVVENNMPPPWDMSHLNDSGEYSSSQTAFRPHGTLGWGGAGWLPSGGAAKHILVPQMLWLQYACRCWVWHTTNKQQLRRWAIVSISWTMTCICRVSGCLWPKVASRPSAWLSLGVCSSCHVWPWHVLPAEQQQQWQQWRHGNAYACSTYVSSGSSGSSEQGLCTVRN